MKNLILKICLFLIVVNNIHSQVIITEYSASNLNQFPDNYAKFEDWILLENRSQEVFDISGYGISDKESKPLKWIIPEGTILNPGEKYTLWCSGRDESGNGFGHTNFKLTQTKDGEFVVFSDPQGNIIESAALQITHLGHSRIKDQNGDWLINTNPDLENSESASLYNGYTISPLISLEAGYYENTQNVSISTTEQNVTIHYTIDGNAPTQNDPIYNGPITVDQTMVVKARSYSSDPTILPGKISFNTYFINEDFSMAVFSVAADGLQDLANGNGELRPIGSIEYFDINKTLTAKSYGELNRHGQDSWILDHRSIDWISRDEMGYSKTVDAKLFNYSDRTDYQRFMLRASGDDNYPANDDFDHQGSTHVRDEYVQTLAQLADMKLDIRALERVVVFLNGEYWGVYGLRERPADHDYTNEYYNQDKYNLHFLATWGNTWAEYGGQAAFEDWQMVRDFALNADMSDPENYATLRDEFQVQSLIDYMIINLACVSSDWLNYNTGWWRGLNPEGDHKKWGYILWDNDATFDYYINYSGVPNTNPDAAPCDLEEIGEFMDEFYGGDGGYGGTIENPEECPTIQEGSSPYPADDAIFIAVINQDDYCCYNDWDDICQEAYDAILNNGGINDIDPNSCLTIMNGDSPYTAEDSIYQLTINLNPICCDTEWNQECQEIYDFLSSNGGNQGGTENNDVGKHEKIFFKLLDENPDFKQLYYARWADLLNTTFSCESMINTLDSLIGIIEPEMPRQIARWGGSMEEWMSNVDDLKSFVNQRCELIDDGMLGCYDELEGMYDITLEVFPEGAGEIEFNTLDLIAFPWTGSYFGGMDNIIEANNNDGYQFVRWESKSGNIITPNLTMDKARIRLTQTDTLVAIFEEASSFETINKSNFLNVYPSPTRDIININYALPNAKKIDLNIYNSIGQLIHSIELGNKNSGELKIDVKNENLSPGSYIVNLISDEKIYSEKVIII